VRARNLICLPQDGGSGSVVNVDWDEADEIKV
jgi:hypothetical protein